jgi:hypothetical protein
VRCPSVGNFESHDASWPVASGQPSLPTESPVRILHAQPTSAVSTTSGLNDAHNGAVPGALVPATRTIHFARRLAGHCRTTARKWPSSGNSEATSALPFDDCVGARQQRRKGCAKRKTALRRSPIRAVDLLRRYRRPGSLTSSGSVHREAIQQSGAAGALEQVRTTTARGMCRIP